MREHNLLQLIGQWYLYKRYRCRFAATEVEHPGATVDLFDRYGDFTDEEREINKGENGERSIYDVLGIRKNNGTEVIGIEVKTSKQDLNKGYCLAGCHKNFVLIPANLFSYAKERIPSRIGLLLYLPPNLREGNHIDFAIKCKRGAKYRAIEVNSKLLIDRIIERNNSQIRFHLLGPYLNKMI